MRYFDTSAVAKLYIEEPDSATVRALAIKGMPAVSRLTEVEVSSALSRAARRGVVSAPSSAEAVRRFRSDLALWDVFELSSAVVAEAIRLVGRYPLTAADAIQLGTALVLEREIGQALEAFVAFDQRLVEAARAERLRVLPE